MLTCNCIGCRRVRATELVAKLNAEAGPGRVLSGAAQMMIYSAANSGAGAVFCALYPERNRLGAAG